MAENTTTPYVARDSDIAILQGHLDAAIGGSGRTISLQAPLGGGKRALVGEFVRRQGEFNGLLWRTALIEEEEGMRAILRLYASLYASLNRDPMLKGKVEMLLNAQLPQKPKRVQQWYQAFIEGLKKPPQQSEGQGMQITMPRDNPAIGLVEIVRGISAKMPIVWEVQNVHACQSIAVHAIFEALTHGAADGQLLLILSTLDLNDTTRAWLPAPMLDFLDRNSESVHTMVVEPWGEAEASAYLDSRELKGDAAGLATLSGGRPGFLAELADILGDDGKLGDAAGMSMADMWPRTVDEDELDDDGEPAEGRKYATAADIEDVAYRAALLGRAFPSNLLADIGSYDRESIDDLLDAAGDLFEEMQFSKPLGTWIYQFKRASWRDGALQHARANREDAAEVALATGTFLERFLVPRAYDFVVKTARLYAEADKPRRAAVLRGMAISGDQPQVWAMAQDMLKFFADIEWPDAMRRTVYMNLMDRMAGSGDVNQAEALFNEILEWADSKEDRPLKAWLLFSGSKLDYRRQDYYRARDRAKDAQTLYNGIGDKLKVAEIHNHLAMVELSDGNPTAAKERVDQALKTGQVETPEGKAAVLPQIAGNAEFIRGLVQKRERKFKEAGEHFQRANLIASQSGQAQLALEAGVNFGECLLVSGDPEQAASVLQRVVGIAQSLNNPVRQRTAASLLAQAHASLKNFDQALNWSKATLEMSQKLKFQRFIPIDTYNVGLFSLMMKKPTEAMALFRQARSATNISADVNFSKELLFNMGMAAKQLGETAEAKDALTALLPVAAQAKDARKFVVGSGELAAIHTAAGESDVAKRLLDEALKAADTANLKEERRQIKKKLDELSA